MDYNADGMLIQTEQFVVDRVQAEQLHGTGNSMMKSELFTTFRVCDQND